MAAKRDIPVRPVGVRSWVGHAVHLAIAGLLLTLSFPPIGWWPAAYVALVPIGVLAKRSVGGGRLFVGAWAVFFLWWCFMIRWVVAVHVLAMAGIALVLGLYVAVACWSLWWIGRRYQAAASTLTLPMVWVSMDYLRGMFPLSGFAWLSLAHSQGASYAGQSAGWVVQSADLFGEHTVGFVVAMTSGLIVDLLTRPLVRPGARGIGRVRRTIRASGVLWALAFFGALVYGRARISEYEPAAGPVVAVVQTNVPQSNKIHRTPEQDAADFDEMVALTRAAAATEPRPDLIVWPETMVPAALNSEAVSDWLSPRAYHPRIEALAREIQTPIVAGAPFWSDPNPQGTPLRRANSAYLYYADGVQAAARYDKRHLVPFGEYLPIVSSVGWLKAFYLDHVSPYPYDYSLRAGTGLTVFELPVNGEGRGARVEGRASILRIVTPICYEDAVGRVVRRMVYGQDGAKRADAVVNLTNSAWYVGAGMRRQHLQIAAFRAIENRAAMARAVNGGISGFIDPLGRIGPTVSEGESGFAAATLNLDRRVTVYGRIGTLPIALMALATGALVVGGWFRKPARRRERQASA